MSIDIPMELIIKFEDRQRQADDCLPVCVATVVNYYHWRGKFPEELRLPPLEEIQIAFIRSGAYREHKGVSLTKLRSHVPKVERKVPKHTTATLDQYMNSQSSIPETALEPQTLEIQEMKNETVKDLLGPLGLKFCGCTPEDIVELHGFLNRDLPPIMLFDKIYYHMGIEGGGHAVILERIDLNREKIYVIDHDSGLRYKTPLDLPIFLDSWDLLENYTLVVVPEEYATLVSE